MMNPLRARYGITVVVTTIATSLLTAADRFSLLNVASTTSHDNQVRTALYGALIAMAGVFIGILLGVISLITSIDERAVVQRMRSANVYDEFIHRLIGPVRSSFALAIAAIVCIVLPEPKTWNGALALMQTILICFTLGLGLGLIFQTGSIASYLGRILLNKPGAPDSNDTPEASRARARAKRESLSDTEKARRTIELGQVA